MDGPAIERAFDAQSGRNLTLDLRGTTGGAAEKIAIEESSSIADLSADRTR